MLDFCLGFGVWGGGILELTEVLAGFFEFLLEAFDFGGLAADLFGLGRTISCEAGGIRMEAEECSDQGELEEAEGLPGVELNFGGGLGQVLRELGGVFGGWRVSK